MRRLASALLASAFLAGNALADSEANDLPDGSATAAPRARR